MAKSDFQKNLITNTALIIFRLVWWNYLDPQKRDTFAEDLFDAIMVGIVQSAQMDMDKKAPAGAAQLLRPIVRSMVDQELGDFANSIPDFGDDTYEGVVQRLLKRRDESRFHTLFASQYDQFTTRIANVSDDLFSAGILINEEFIIWLKTHSDQSKNIHSDAFEQLTGEILASHGFDIQFTGRIKNRSADLIAIEKMENGDETKYLVECKRYSDSNKVGIDILNAVVGASFRAKTSHAMLVTTSSFTSNVTDARDELEDFRLELHDGEQIMEWLADYEFKDFGLWLPTDGRMNGRSNSRCWSGYNKNHTPELWAGPILNSTSPAATR